MTRAEGFRAHPVFGQAVVVFGRNLVPFGALALFVFLPLGLVFLDLLGRWQPPDAIDWRGPWHPWVEWTLAWMGLGLLLHGTVTYAVCAALTDHRLRVEKEGVAIDDLLAVFE